MIIYKNWMKWGYDKSDDTEKKFYYEGWFLFGVIPIYIKKINTVIK